MALEPNREAYPKRTLNGADGISDIEGKAAMGSGERAGRRASFNWSAIMDEPQPSQRKILRGTEGLGTVTPEMIEERTREIAHSDGRTQPNDLDRTRAREELAGATSGSEKPPTREEPGRDWEMPLVSSGEKAPTVRPEDDENIPQKLIEEGIEEADHDRRRSSGQTRST